MRTITKRTNAIVALTATLLVSGSWAANADDHMAPGRISDVLNTKHNFSPSYSPDLPTASTRTLVGTSSEACIYCHTPHGDPSREDPAHRATGNDTVQPFLWNHTDSTVTSYTMYDSSSMDATVVGGNQVGAASKMCLSCHDGTVAIGSVEMAMVGDSVEIAPNIGSSTITDSTTGLNSNIGGIDGTDLSNDHPISFEYTDAIATADGELVSPSTSTELGVRVGRGVLNYNTANSLAGGPTSVSTRKAVPLEKSHVFDGATPATIDPTLGGAVECTSCHDPHIRSVDNSENIKFLRLHRFQKGTVGQVYPDGNFDITTDINCLACHRKASWHQSVHATSDVAYDSTGTASSDREFPDNIKVWEASCLNCHDAHTVKGARYLLREGTSGSLLGGLKTDDGTSAIEETCFQCHGSNSVLSDTASKAKNIETVVAVGGHNPTDFSGAANVHDVTNADLSETQANLRTNRHVSCTDCHNPHRILKNAAYDGSGTDPLDKQATHDHSGGAIHSNVASGALRGATGVDPDYAGSDGTFDPYRDDLNNPLTYTVLTGDPDNPAAINLVTKEFQVCLKCHSGYGLTDTDIGVGLSENTAAEFMPNNDTAGHTAPNHNSWHPVTGATARASADRANMVAANTFESPFDLGLGSQTMYCSDCHTNVEAKDPQTRTQASGPHGGTGGMLIASGDTLCDTCHTPAQYSSTVTTSAAAETSGFSCANSSCITANAENTGDEGMWVNLHVYHRVNSYSTACTDCHVARPHGWSNKALLANIQDVGQTTAYTSAPYYQSAQLRIINAADFKTSGNWDKLSCGTVGGCHDGNF